MSSNGGYVTRAELSAHLGRLEDKIDTVDRRAVRIERGVAEAAGQRWFGSRTSRLIDRVLPLFLVAAFTYLLTHYATGG